MTSVQYCGLHHFTGLSVQEDADLPIYPPWHARQRHDTLPEAPVTSGDVGHCVYWLGSPRIEPCAPSFGMLLLVLEPKSSNLLGFRLYPSACQEVRTQHAPWSRGEVTIVGQLFCAASP